MMDLQKKYGIFPDGINKIKERDMQLYIQLQLELLGLSVNSENALNHVTKEIIDNIREKSRGIKNELSPIDSRIQQYLDDYFKSDPLVRSIKVPTASFALDIYGLSRLLSFPVGKTKFESEYVKSYKVKQGVLHNPHNDRRTTKGVFHIAENGLPIPDDKKAVPLHTAAYLFGKALTETGDIMTLPYTAEHPNPAKTWVSLLLRPIVSPEVKSLKSEKTMEIRCFAPGSLVSNLDFLESIFGNMGNPYYLANDAALDPEHWTGHTGLIVLAPQLTKITKQEAGLPPHNQATERQKRDGMCWKDPNELYNDGSAFKLTLCTEKGFIATVIADNYFGYSKKEVKTQISFAANLFGNAEEEHSGGAYIFPSYSQGDKHIAKNEVGAKYEEIAPMFPENIIMQPEGYGKDAVYDNIFYVREDSDFDLVRQTVRWFINAQDYHIKLLPNHIYITPNGSKFRIEKTSGTKYYRLVECVSEGSLFHKSCTVSGGGKSEISKSLYDSIFQGSFYVNDFEEDFKKVNEIIDRDYSDRFKVPKEEGHKSRAFLSSKRSLGSVIKLLTPTDENTDEFNAWLDSYPQHIKGLAFIVKRFYHKSWGNDWKSHFSVDILNGRPGHELKYNNKIVYARYLRVGFDREGNWRTFKLRQDFNPADKLQFEDDITASTIVPVADLEPKRLNTKNLRHSFKFVSNCESRFFQRPDDAIHKGFDKKAESDLASPNTFISNFEALTPQDAVEMLEDTNSFEQFTQPMQDLIREVATKKNCDYFVCSANPRLIDGKASKNVRYLQTNSMLLDAESSYITEIALRMSRKLPFDKPLFTPVTDVLPGRRNNPAEENVRPLAVYNPLHYQELPELFMDFLASLTGKSPSTTGAGSEGALTKAPFNALLPIIDLNNALISYILTGYPGYTTPAGYIGKEFKIDHDLSLLMPEVLARMSIQEKKPEYLLENGYLEKVSDFDYKGQTVKASILGYRITQKFINNVFGRVFENPNVVFTEKMLRPELQNKDEFVEGINNIIENQKIAAEKYFSDGSINMAIPPLKALLNIMVYGEYEGLTLEDPKFRKMFTYDYLIKSDFYKERLKNKQANDIWLFTKFVENLGKSIEKMEGDKKSMEILTQKLHYAEDILSKVSTPEYLARLQDTLGLNEI